MSFDQLAFFKTYPEISYNKGDKILRPNEYFDHIYFVKSGYVRIYKVLSTGQEITLSCYNPKKQKFAIFGYTPLLADYHVEAFTNVVLHRAPKSEYEKYIQKNPEMKDYVIQDFKIFFEELIKQVEWLSIPDAYTRIKAIMHSLAERIGQQSHGDLTLDNKANLEIKITHHLIASFTGLSRETVTIQINKLISEGYLARKNNTLVIQDMAGLAKAIG